MKRRKKWLQVALVGAITIVLLIATLYKLEAEASKQTKKPPTNVIMLIMDGSSNNTITLARWYKGKNLALDGILTGAVTTYSAESAITNSAPAATALATGHKSNSGYIGVLPSKVDMPGVKEHPANALTPVANVLEGAK